MDLPLYKKFIAFTDSLNCIFREDGYNCFKRNSFKMNFL